MFTEGQLKVIRFCAEACARQKSGEISVANMILAYDFATWRSDTFGSNGEFYAFLDFIEELGKTIEPKANSRGFRYMGVFKRDENALDPAQMMVPIGCPPERIVSQLTTLIASYNEGNLTVEEFYKEFEEIHPFFDGNGRTGEILYNFLRGTLDNPIVPPDFWNNERTDKYDA